MQLARVHVGRAVARTASQAEPEMVRLRSGDERGECLDCLDRAAGCVTPFGRARAHVVFSSRGASVYCSRYSRSRSRREQAMHHRASECAVGAGRTSTARSPPPWCRSCNVDRDDLGAAIFPRAHRWVITLDLRVDRIGAPDPHAMICHLARLGRRACGAAMKPVQGD